MSSAIASNTVTLHSHDTVLSRHLQQCEMARGRWFGAAMLAEELHKLVAPRFATTVVLAAVLVTASCAWL